MYIERVPNRKSPPCILLRESYREGAKVRKRTIANLTKLSPEVIEGLRLLLKAKKDDAIFEIVKGMKVMVENKQSLS